MDEDKNFKEDALFKNNLHVLGKSEYVKGKRPDVKCIFCAIRDNVEGIITKKLYQDHEIVIALPARIRICHACEHLFPCRHEGFE